MNRKLRFGVTLLAVTMVFTTVWRVSGVGAATAVSKRLADVVAGGSMSSTQSCKGTIDLTRATGSYSTITAEELNALIADNSGSLVLVVDVNEANGGLETARAQGIAVKRAELKVAGVTIGGGTANPAINFQPFSTQTQAQIAEAGTTTRRTWYTVLGDAGSNEVTPRNVDGKVFDSTLRIPVSGTFPSGATDIKLHVEFLKTNVGLGDPEDFYDCTGGSEDFALVTRPVTQYFDVTVPTTSAFRAEAPSLQLSPEGLATTNTTVATAPSYSWIAVPGASTFRMVGYEDLYPNQGDYDFNDTVIAYRYALRVNASGLVDQVTGEAYLIARGSNYSHEWNLAIPVSGLASGSATCVTTMAGGGAVPAGRACTIAADGGSIRWHAFDGTRILMPPADPLFPQQNTRNGNVVRGPRAAFTVSLPTPLSVSAFGADDPWLRVIDTRQEIHLSTRAGASPLPFAMVLPSDFQIATEETDLTVAYPKLATFAASGGTQAADWYRSPVAGNVVSWKLADWAWMTTP